MIGLLTGTNLRRRHYAAASFGKFMAGNAGNVIFDDALRALYPSATPIGRKHLSESHGFSHLILPLANAVSASPMPEGLTQLHLRLRRAVKRNPELRIVVTSLGAQYNDLRSPVVVHPDRVAFIKDLSRWAEYIGVRGFFSAEVLGSLGIDNVWVVGDPGLLHPRLAPKSKAGTRGGVVVSWTPTGRYRDKIKSILTWGQRHDATYVAQSDEEGFKPAKGGRLTPRDSLVKTLQYYLWPSESDVGSVKEWLSSRGTWFHSASQWSAQLAGHRLAIGMRIHGSAAALIAGVPVVQFVFDSRTAELCSFHGVPSISLDDFDADMSVEDLVALSSTQELYSKLPGLRGNLWDYWKALSLPVETCSRDSESGIRWLPGADLGQGDYRQRALRHALIPGSTGVLSQSQLRALAQAVTTPRDDALCELIELAPMILWHLRGRVSPSEYNTVAQRLGVVGKVEEHT